jgi:hypothetical protein
MSMKIHSPEHFAEVTQFALDNGCLLKLAERLDYLTTYGGGGNICHLHKDFAPNSFEFLMCRPDGSSWFNGGLIYSGPGQPADGSFPSLTVSLDNDSSKHAWGVHT